MPLSPHCVKRVLDWVTGAAAVDDPTGRYVGLIDAGGNELSDSIGYSRLTASFAAAGSPDATASMLNTMRFGSYASAPPTTVRTLALFDAATSGHVLFYTVCTTDLVFTAGGGVGINRLSIMLW